MSQMFLNLSFRSSVYTFKIRIQKGEAHIMEILSFEFLSALITIVFIDLILAGDNAIVIGLAARKLPKEQQTKAVIWVLWVLWLFVQ